ncbi:hypothetical protein AAFC00_005830 [Neodothiora populina]|uniref:Uncharacterized protein n=1 Tax=Neodothiora populina TaxID=2781224 RepID=A0ABR3P7B2_9PEZI
MHHRSKFFPVFFYLFLIQTAWARLALQHNAIERRQNDVRPYSGSLGAITGGTGKQVLTFVTPSPHAIPVPITTQSQTVTSFIPQYTLCELPPGPEASVMTTPTLTTAPYKNFTVPKPSSTKSCTTIYSPTISMVCATVLTGLVDRYSVTACNQYITFSTNYGYALVTPTLVITYVPLNATTVAGPTGVVINGTLIGTFNGTSGEVADNVPSIDISSTITASPSASSPEALEDPETMPASMPDSPPTSAIVTTTTGMLALHRRANVTLQQTTIMPPPMVQTMTTYYLAPWQQFTSPGSLGHTPQNVDLEICTTFANSTRSCILEFHEWITSLATITTATTTSVNLTTKILGPSQVIVETLSANVTVEATTFRLQTAMVLEYETVGVITSMGTRGPTSTGPTMYQTLTVVAAGETASPATPTRTSTSTIRTTRTVTVLGGTTTVIVSDAIKTLPVGVTSLDAASALGVGS